MVYIGGKAMKKFHLTDEYVLMNFDSSEIDSKVSIINSWHFQNVLRQFYTRLQKEDHEILKQLGYPTTQELLGFYRLLITHNFDQASQIDPNLIKFRTKRRPLLHFTNMFYDHWRALNRFGMMRSSMAHPQSAKYPEMIAATEVFSENIIALYRSITETILGRPHTVYRQLPAGTNASLLYATYRLNLEEGYENLYRIPLITTVATQPPFIVYTKSNIREGVFEEIDHNPINYLSIDNTHYYIFPLLVGDLLAFCYIHRDLLHQGIGLTNLFEIASPDYCKNAKPDLIFLYGIREDEFDCKFHHDKENDVYIGFVSRAAKNDYFGYLKKMVLTLHNVAMINRGNLPVHGAMVRIDLNNNKRRNVVIIGDSGAGKSETLEALRVIGKDYIKSMEVVFDDMGVFSINNKVVSGSGTEIGAFVRLDDLDAGYAYEEFDRAIFMNPDQTNARLIMPLSSYEFISTKHPIHLVLYANNYEDKEGLRLFDNVDEALDVFKAGRRRAKGTTSEKGLVESYFANPFGPLQRKEQTEVLLENYFNLLDQRGVLLGELYTKLALPGFETSGPQLASEILLQYLLEQ